MSDFDPTTNIPPFDLLTPEEKEAFEAWPHGWEVFMRSFMTTEAGDRLPMIVYRGKPAPVVKQRFLNVYPNGTGLSYGSRQEALDAAQLTSAIGMIYIEIVDEEIKDVGKVGGVYK